MYIIMNFNNGPGPGPIITLYNNHLQVLGYHILVVFARGLNKLHQFQIRIKFKVLLNKAPIF